MESFVRNMKRSVRLNCLIIVLLIFKVSICIAIDPTFQDYLVTKKNDTIYGKISWKNNIVVFVENENGKQKFRADKVSFFQRGAFRYVSIHTKFPEYLREVINGEISYYVESFIKYRTTIDYAPSVYLKYGEKIYTINLPNVKYNLYSLPNTNGNLKGNEWDFNKYYGNIDYQFSNFKSAIKEIIGEESPVYQIIENENYTFDDITEIIKLYNKYYNSFDSLKNFNMQFPDKKFSRGYVILSNNDTIKGTIKNTDQLKMSDRIIFKDLNGDEHKYDPQDILGFGINNRAYVSYVFERRISEKKIFLERMNSGKISLFVEYYSSSTPFQNNYPKPTFFDYNLNVQAKYYLKKGNDDFIPVDTDYKFLDLFKDKNAIYERIIANEYKRYEIENMVIQYNNAP